MTKNHLTNAIMNVQSQNGEIIGFAPEHGETQLYTVFAKFERDTIWKTDGTVGNGIEYTVWNYNAEFDGMFTGYYTSDYENARDEFVRRIMKK